MIVASVTAGSPRSSTIASTAPGGSRARMAFLTAAAWGGEGPRVQLRPDGPLAARPVGTDPLAVFLDGEHRHLAALLGQAIELVAYDPVDRTPLPGVTGRVEKPEAGPVLVGVVPDGTAVPLERVQVVARGPLRDI